MKHADVQPGTQNDYGYQHNGKDPKFKIDDHMRISTYKNSFAKG